MKFKNLSENVARVTEYSAVHNNELIYYFRIQRASTLFGRLAFPPRGRRTSSMPIRA